MIVSVVASTDSKDTTLRKQASECVQGMYKESTEIQQAKHRNEPVGRSKSAQRVCTGNPFSVTEEVTEKRNDRGHLEDRKVPGNCHQAV